MGGTYAERLMRRLARVVVGAVVRIVGISALLSGSRAYALRRFRRASSSSLHIVNGSQSRDMGNCLGVSKP